jgi:hypothetical protein
MMKLFWIMVVVAGMAVAVPAQAEVNKDLEKGCQHMALRAHPSTLPDTTAVANLRHDYYKLCITRRGKMDQELTPTQ